MPARKKSLQVPQTPLLSVLDNDMRDALHTISCAIDVTATALAAGDDPFQSRAAMVLHEHAFEPIERIREELAEQAERSRQPVHVEPLLRPKKRKKHAPKGSRKGKRRQRNRWKDRQKALKPWER